MIARHLSLLICCMALTLLACGPPQSSQTPPSGSVADAAAALNAQLDALWELNMERFPTWATYEGDRRYDDRIMDASKAADDAYIAAREAIAAKVEAIDPAGLSPMDRDTRRMVLESTALLRAEQVCHQERWSVSGLGGPQVDFAMLPVFHSIRNDEDLANLEARYRATGVQVDQIIEHLRSGVATGYTPTRINTQRALDQLEALLATPVEQDPMLTLKSAEEGREWPRKGLEAALREVVRPALTRYRDVLRDEVLPAALPDGGIAPLPTGSECYRARMMDHIGPGFDPDELHQRGLDQLTLAHQGMVEVGRALGLEDASARDVIEYITSKPEHFAESEAALITANEAVVARARAAMPAAFGRLPAAAVVVRAMEAHRASGAPAAYYYSAPEDRSRPAIYYVNTLEPTTRPLYNLEALAFHEAIPGHHLQIALAQELPEVHIWRRNAGQTAYVEGWALYAELLADEMGLYSSPLDRFGMYNYQAWRAARLVIDTGLHHKGWSRERAIEFLLQNTALPQGEVENEIDRYIAWPGQALAYMVGRLEIQALRAEAEETLGDKFSLHAFHDAIHARGAVPLLILRENIRDWIATQ